MSSRTSADEFLWFTTWVNQRLGACLTFARGSSWQQMLDGFGIPAAPCLPAEHPFDPYVDRSRVQVGSNSQWGWAIEDFTAMGSAPATLGRLSSGGSEALALTLTETVSFFHYAADGSVVSVFDLVVPHIRYGCDPHRLDEQMAQAGFLDGTVPDPPSMGALLAQLAFGLTITEDMIQDVSCTAELPLPPTLVRTRGPGHPGPQSRGPRASDRRSVTIRRPRTGETSP